MQLKNKEEGRPPTVEDREVVRERMQECSEIFNQLDIHDFVNSNKYFDRFWRHSFYMPGQDQRDDCFHLARESLRWREEFGARDITEEDLDDEDKMSGNVYAHPRDRQDRKVLIFSTRKHIKDSSKTLLRKKFLIYMLERLQREEDGREITIMFDCEGAGVRNMDIDLIQFTIQVLTQYYPSMVNYILVFELPWVLNAAWKMIKSLLPAQAVSRIKFVNKETLDQYIDEDNRLVSWGGKDTWQYTWIPEHVNEQGGDQEQTQGNHPSATKSVSMMTLKPETELLFNVNEKGNLSTQLEITNIHSKPIVYKIKTTSPEIFKVRPHVGFLKVGDSAIARLESVGRINVLQERFQILSTEVTANEELPPSELFKAGQVFQGLKLRCQTTAPPDLNRIVRGQVAINHAYRGPQLTQHDLSSNLEKLEQQLSSTEAQVRYHARLNMLLVVANLLIIVVLVMRLFSSSDEPAKLSCPRPSHYEVPEAGFPSSHPGQHVDL